MISFETAMLVVENLSFERGDATVLTDVNFSLSYGELLHLKGSNGKGKTSLLRIVAGLIQNYHGTVRKDLVSQEVNQSICSFISHNTSLYPLLSIKENYLTEYARCPQRFGAVAESLGLLSHMDVPLQMLSAGMKQKALLMRLCFSNATLWLLDEPFSALDQAGVSVLLSMIQSHRQNQGMCIVTSHQSLPSELEPYREYCL